MQKNILNAFIFSIIFGFMMLIFFFVAKARLPDSNWLTAQSWDTLTVEKWNNLVPSSAVMAFYATSCPIWWKPANGSSGTPDLRWKFIRWLNSFEDGSNAISLSWDTQSGRTLWSYQDDSFQWHRHAFYSYGNNWEYKDTTSNQARMIYNHLWNNTAWRNDIIRNPISDWTNGTPRTASETRPRNVGLIYCMKK